MGLAPNGDGPWRQRSRQGPECGLDEVGGDDADDFGWPGVSCKRPVGRYGQGSATAKGPAQGLGSKVKRALETAIRLAPEPAAARIALGPAPLW